MKRLLKVATIGSIFLLALCTVAAAQTTTVPETINVPVVAGPAGPQGPIGLTGPQGPVGPAGAQGPIGVSGSSTPAACATSIAVNPPTRVYDEPTPQSGDTVTKASTAFASLAPIGANTFTVPGQTIHLVAAFDLASGMAGTPQLQMELDGSADLSPAVGIYIGTATTQPWEWQADIWITAVTVGTSGTIEVHGNYVEQTQNTIANQLSGGVSPFPNTLPFSFDTTKAHTLGFATGVDSFTGSLQQRELMATFWP